MKTYTPRGPGSLSALRRTVILAGMLCSAIGAAAFGSPLMHTAYAAGCAAGSTIPAVLSGIGSVTPPPSRPHLYLTGGSITINIDGGQATFTSDGSGNITVVQNAPFTGQVDVSSGPCDITSGASGSTNSLTASTGLPSNTPLSCGQLAGEDLNVQPEIDGTPAGSDTLSFQVKCANMSLQVSATVRLSGNGLPTPEAPSSVLFGGGVALLLLGFGYRSRRKKVARS